MINQRIRFFFVFVFISGLLVIFIYFNITRPRLLILHSYDATYAWTRDVNAGLNRVLNGYPHYAIHWHYMDTKRHPETDFKRIAGIAAQQAIAKWQPHVVIAIDDDAQEYAAKFFVNHPSIAIVFAGVNGEVTQYDYPGAQNVTGVFERKQLVAIKELMQDISQHKSTTPHTKEPAKLIHIGDNSGSVQLDVALIETFKWDPVKFLGSKSVNTFEEWKMAVQEAGKTANYILLTNYRKLARSDTDKTRVPSGEVVTWTEKNSTIPLIGSNVFNVEDGASLAVGVSPYEQGDVSAKMAVEIIEKKRNPASISFQSTKQFIISLRKEALRQRNIMLPSIYETFARATNNYYEIGTATTLKSESELPTK